MHPSGIPYRRGRISTVNLRILTTSDELLLMLKNILFFNTKQAIIMRRSTVLHLILE
jgi:hypothetical protein